MKKTKESYIPHFIVYSNVLFASVKMDVILVHLMVKFMKIKVNHSIVPQRIDFKVLHEFVDGKNAYDKARFPNAIRVLDSKSSAKVGAI